MKRLTLFSWRRIFGTFLSGLFALLPIVVTLSVVMWLIGLAEGALGGVLRSLLPGDAYRPGMGVVVTLALIFVVGLLTQAFFFRQVLSWFEDLIERIPLIKTLFSAVKDLTGFMARARDSKKQFGQVVMIQLPDIPLRLLGFVTLENLRGLDPAQETSDEVAVYLPMSYQIGGYTVLVPRRHLTPLNMGMEEAMRFVITAGLSRSDEEKSSSAG